MAKVKSKKITIEEALVPVEEQPYEIPQNWCWVYLENLCEYMKAGGDKPSDMSDIKTDELNVPVIANGIQNEGIMGYTSIPIIEDKTVTVSGRGTIGYSIYRDYPYYPIVRLIVLKTNQCLQPQYLKYIFDYFEEEGTGSSIPQLTVPSIKKKNIPLPPVIEQQRIVEQIERLFAKLDEAKEKAQESIEGFQDRVDSILYKAFNGELSSAWRIENGVNPHRDSVVFRDILDVRDGTHDSPQYYDEGYPLVTSKNLKNGCITDKDIKFIGKEDFDQINQRSKVDIGDVLFAMIGTIGNPVVIEDEPNYAIKNVALFKNKGKVNPYFIKYYLESREVRDKMQKEAKGTTQKFVSLGYLRDFPISIPSDLEQEYIVKKLDALLGKEYQAKSIIDDVNEQIDMIKKSILAKAFRGELGTNIPEEESAIELLKTILDKGGC